MDFITFQPADQFVTLLLFGLAVGGIAILGFLGIREKHRLAGLTTVLIMLTFVGAVYSALSGWNSARDDHKRAVIAEANAVYSIELTDEEERSLWYPEEKPLKDFESFGSFERMLPGEDGGYELNRVFLIWENDEMVLAKSADGEDFTPLEAEKR